MFKSIKRWWCRRYHTEHWQLIEHGHRRCSKCKFDLRRTSSAAPMSSAARKRLPR